MIEDPTMISRVLDFDAIRVRRALEEAGISFEERSMMDGSRSQFKMAEFYVSSKDWERASSVADEAVNL